MKVNIDRIDIINMIRGTRPSCELIDKYTKLELGYYHGAYNEWRWDEVSSKSWDRFPEVYLMDLYKKAKESNS